MAVMTGGDVETAPDRARTALKEAQTADTLRLLTCGSVDDGKSTLIGRLLHDADLLMDDQIADLARESARHGKAGEAIDYALLVDGLEAEREQGITIDVAYRYFATPRRRFIIADTPGHEQYTRNMATGASTADLAVLLVDATKGLLTQTRRHAVIASLLGIRHALLAVNKMDLIDFDQTVFAAIESAFRNFCGELEFTDIVAVPVSALHGDNIVTPSPRTPWYDGPTVVDQLEGVRVGDRALSAPLRLPVQYVVRPDGGHRGFAGLIASGNLAPGDEIAVVPSGRTARVATVSVGADQVDHAVARQSVLVTLDREIDVSRGDMMVEAARRPDVSDQFQSHLVWMGDDPLLPGRPYLMKIGCRTVAAQVTDLKYVLAVDTLEHKAAKILHLNEVGIVNLSTAEPVPFDPYAQNRETGAFVLIDRFTNATVAAGMIDFALRRATNIHWQALDIDRSARAAQKHQAPTVLWFTGLSGSGKSTVANLVEKKLFALGRHTYTLDGDNVRHGLNRDLGFTDADRVENIRRVAETARLMADAGLIVLVSFISPFRSERQLARSLMGKGEFVEVFVDTPIDVCRARDPKGLYARADAGEIRNFTGIDSPYELPENAEIRLDTVARTPDALADDVIALLERMGRLSAR